MAAIYANSGNQVASLKELYKDEKRYMQDLVYKENPFYALVPKDESPDGFAGKYIPVPLRSGNPQGRSHTFANAQGNQTATSLESFFVYIVEDYQLVTITNLLMEQTKSNAGAFVDAAKLQIDGGFENIANNTAFELFNSGTATRGISAASSTQTGGTPNTVTLQLTQPSAVVQFEVGQTLVSSTTDGGAPSLDTVQLTSVNRISGLLIGTASVPALSANWAIGTGMAFLTVQGDLPAAGASSTGSALALTGLAGWIPFTTPALTDSFWGVNRSIDPTRLAGLRYDATAFTIEEGVTNALALANREGAKPDMMIMNFTSYAALVNALGAKVEYVQIEHDEVEVAFEGIRFHSAYGIVTVLADRSCPPTTAYILTMDTWQLRSLGKVPHILSYGMEGLEGLRVGNADALEVRIGQYCNLICNAPGRNMVVMLSA